MLKLIFGNDAFQIREALARSKNEFQKNNADASLLYFDMDEDIHENTFFNALESGSLFSQAKLIISYSLIKNLQAESQKKLISKLEKLERSLNTIILIETEKPRKNSPLLKYAIQKGSASEFNYLQGSSLNKWVSDYVKKETSNSMEISSGAINQIIAFVGPHLYLLSNELNKIISFKGNEKIIESEDIKKMVNSSTSATIFETIEAVLEKNKSKALKLFHGQLEKGEDPFYIFSMYTYQLRVVLKISSLLKSTQYDEQTIAKRANIHPFVIKKTMQKITGIPNNKIKLLYKKLLDIDIGIKTGKKDLIASLDQFIIST